MDQANKLRDIVKQRESAKPKESMAARVITVTSGKGGVGKSNLTLNLAIQLRKLDMRVTIIDADLGLANIEVLSGIIPRYNFGDVVNSKMSLESALTDGPLGVKFLSGGAGLTTLAHLTEKQVQTVISSFGMLDDISDIILIDTGAGISKNVLNFVKASSETILIVTPEPTSIADAYAIIKSIKRENDIIPALKIVVNLVGSFNEGVDIFEKLEKVSEQFLGIKLESLGSIPLDQNMPRAVKRQEPLSLSFPNSESAKGIHNISLRLLNMEPKYTQSQGGITGFLNRLAGSFRIYA
ncbi:MAG: MinD/ParA family protein [Clostridiales bacterium]|jgi:flagellar biosynthesis protein FlhG|nr:MinD/ParA family protein [Clostridiales bacterium]